MKIIILMSVLFLSACASTMNDNLRIDGKTEDSFDKSFKAMQVSLGNKDRCLLEAATIRIQLGDKAEQVKKTGNSEAQPSPLSTKIAGLNAKEIIEYSNRYPNVLFSMCRN